MSDPYEDIAHITEASLADLIGDLLQDPETGLPDEIDVVVKSFEEAGVLTNNKGLVVRINGVEFQITIVKC